MRKLSMSICLTTISLLPAAAPVGVRVPFVPSKALTPYIVYKDDGSACFVPNPENKIIEACFKTKKELYTHIDRRALVARSRWQSMQYDTTHCLTKDVYKKKNKEKYNFPPSVCPYKYETLNAYLQRMNQEISAVGTLKDSLGNDDFFSKKFWDLPWKLQRYVLAGNVAFGLLKVNDKLPVENIAPLDLAVRNDDDEVIIFLALNNALVGMMMRPELYKPMLVQLIRSRIPQSVQVLEMWGIAEISVRRSLFDALVDSACFQMPTLVRAKADLLFFEGCDFSQKFHTIKEYSSGEIALREFLYEKMGLFEKMGCQII